MTALKDTFTSTGSKFFHHQEAMMALRAGKGQCVTAHAMICDACNHSCGFCSVHHREGNTLGFDEITGFFDILLRYKLKSAIISGGGNPILYKCKKTGKNFNHVVSALHERGLEIGLITNGAKLRTYGENGGDEYGNVEPHRSSWHGVLPETIDKLTWIRISMAGLDHAENEVYVPDVDPSKTTLGFSYVAHDLYDEPADKKHGKVSTQADLLTLNRSRCKPTWWFKDRVPLLTEQIGHYVEKYHPKYVRLLPNCLEPSMIPERCAILQEMADAINPDVVFVQYKPPAAPKRCFLGYIHPVLNSDGFVLPCDSCCLNESSGHKLGEAWRICHWSEIAKLYEQPVRSLIKDPSVLCPGCVFTQSNRILEGIVDGTADITPPMETPTHANFV